MNYSIEQQMLRLVTLRPESMLECGNLKGRHFEVRYHGLIFDTVSRMYDEKKKVSMTAINAEIGEEWAERILSDILKVRVDGGAQSLSESILDAYVGRASSLLIKSYADILETRKGRTELVGELLEKLGGILDDDEEATLTTTDIVSLKLLEILRNPDKNSTSIRTGLSKLDWITGGVQRGMMTILAGLPGSGKSALMANIIVNMALAGEKPYLSSLEDRSIYVTGRMVSRLSGINAENINKAMNISLSDVDSIERAIERNRDALSRIHIDDSSGQSVQKIRRTCMYLQSKGLLTAAFVDHMGEVASNSRSKYDAASKNAEGLRDIANDTYVPLIAGAQVARSAISAHAHGSNVNHMDCIPRAHHLRDSGRIEETARAIWFVHRPAMWNSDESKSDFWVSVAKSSHGKTGLVKMHCDLSTMTVSDDGDSYE